MMMTPTLAVLFLCAVSVANCQFSWKNRLTNVLDIAEPRRIQNILHYIQKESNVVEFEKSAEMVLKKVPQKSFNFGKHKHNVQQIKLGDSGKATNCGMYIYPLSS